MVKTSTPSSKRASPKASLQSILSSQRRPLVMGIVNATPDSFYAASRGGFESADRLVREGADILDIGGQSTRPGSDPVPLKEELSRVIPLIKALSAKSSVPISVDTDKAEVARQALEAGARIVNDVSALRSDPGMAEAVQGAEAVILMHRGGASPKTMQEAPAYKDVVGEVREFLRERKALVKGPLVLVDPGIGFGKTVEHNLSLIKRVSELAALGPVVLGVSRKSFIGHLLGGLPPEERLEGSLAVAAWAALQGVKVLRVHDVAATRRALDVLAAVGAAS